MDKQKIELLQQRLFAELSIGSILYKNKSQQTLLQIKCSLNNDQYSDEFISNLLVKLVSYGIITAHLIADNNIFYQITDFGNYFFEKLIHENNHFKNFIESTGDIQ